MDIFEKCKRIPIADEAKAAGIYPYFHSLTSRQDTSVQMSGRQVIMLGSNNYLGLTSHPEPYLSSALFPASVTSGWEVSPR